MVLLLVAVEVGIQVRVMAIKEILLHLESLHQLAVAVVALVVDKPQLQVLVVQVVDVEQDQELPALVVKVYKDKDFHH
jgi:hypothetical protein